MKPTLALSVLSFAVLAAPAPGVAATACAVPDIAALAVPNVTIAAANAVPAAGTHPAYCDVTGSVATDGEGAGPGSGRFAARLPANWNGRFLASSPGAFGGNLSPVISATDAEASLVKGYAFVTNDSGHVNPNLLDASWALQPSGEPDRAKLADYAYRATHQVTVAAKAMVKAFYAARRIQRSYFDGCSNAGRNGLMAAMRYPDDYDGIIAAAPYLDARIQLAGYKSTKAFLDAYVPPPLVPAIDAAVRASCDAADGVVDGLIQNPAKCAFDPHELVPGTLTEAQADALDLYFRAVRDEHDRVVYPGSTVSDLSGAGGFGGFVPWIVLAPPSDPAAAQPWGNAAPLAWRAADGLIRYQVERDAAFDANLDWPEWGAVVDREAVRRLDRATRTQDTDDPHRLAPFLRRGAKLILYHGYSDATLPPFRTVTFYRDLAEGHGGYRELQDGARLFMAPGLLHCEGGPGPNAFDTLTALEDWVERGVAPRSILATHYVNNNPALGADRTMPLCPFPAQARYSGHGDVNAAASWSCASRDRRLLEVGPNGRQAGADRP
jgi:feruloyl esterase